MFVAETVTLDAVGDAGDFFFWIGKFFENFGGEFGSEDCVVDRA